jgi:MFS transporter, FSR family, fosmidomycin resistance protein
MMLGAVLECAVLRRTWVAIPSTGVQLTILKNRIVLAVALGHGAIDFLASVTLVLIAFLSIPLGLSNTQVGLAATFYTATGSLSQPIFGHLADRFGGRRFAIGGVLWMALWFSVASITSSFVLLLLCLALAGLGSGAYHPQGAMNAFLAGGERKGGSLSIWSLGGAIGYALGPVLAGFLFEAVGQIGAMAFAIAVVPVAVVLARALPRGGGGVGESDQSGVREFAAALKSGGLLGSVLALLALIIARSWAYTALNTYIPRLYASQGHQATEYGSLLSAILMALAAGTFVGGFLADRIGRWRVINISLALTGFFYLGLLQLGLPWAALPGVVGGFLLGMSQSPSMVVVQELLPGRAGLISGLLMGFMFVTGAIGTSITGVIADQVGLLQTLHGVSLLPLVAAGLGVLVARKGLEASPQA